MAGESAGESARRMRAKSERLARSAEQWERGAEGERATAAALEALPNDEWTVLHDRRWPGRQYANIDHVAVGPPGVFVIDSKNWSGRIEVKDDVLRQNGRARTKAIDGATDAANAIRQLMASAPPDHVHPVLCFVRDEPVAGLSGDVTLCSTANVVSVLESGPAVLAPAQRRQLCREFETVQEELVTTRRLEPALSSRRPATEKRAQQRRRNRRGERVRLVASGAIAIGLLFVVTQTDAPQRFGDFFTSVLLDEVEQPPAQESGP